MPSSTPEPVTWDPLSSNLIWSNQSSRTILRFSYLWAFVTPLLNVVLALFWNRTFWVSTSPLTSFNIISSSSIHNVKAHDFTLNQLLIDYLLALLAESPVTQKNKGMGWAFPFCGLVYSTQEIQKKTQESPNLPAVEIIVSAAITCYIN